MNAEGSKALADPGSTPSVSKSSASIFPAPRIEDPSCDLNSSNSFIASESDQKIDLL